MLVQILVTHLTLGAVAWSESCSCSNGENITYFSDAEFLVGSTLMGRACDLFCGNLCTTSHCIPAPRVLPQSHFHRSLRLLVDVFRTLLLERLFFSKFRISSLSSALS